MLELSSMYYLLLIIVIFTAFYNLFRLRQSILFLETEVSNFRSMKTDCRTRLFILIPVLHEQRRIIETLKYFQQMIPKKADIFIVVCTTAKEGHTIETDVSTHDLVVSYIENNPGRSVEICHYPITSGAMAHQLNFAISKLASECRLRSNDYIAIYNADSRPHPSTFHWFFLSLNASPEKRVIQQPAIFLRNYSDLQSSLTRAAALYQSCWTLTHEIPRLRRQSEGNAAVCRFANAHCVGHGLFVRYDVVTEVGPFPEDTLTEDVYFGFLLRCASITIYPLPLLELGDSPTTFLSLLKQKYVWFWGPMLYPYYVCRYIRSHGLSIQNLIISFVLASQGFLNAMRWITVGPIIICLVSLPIISSDLSIIMLLMSFLAIIFYISVPVVAFTSAKDKLELAVGQQLNGLIGGSISTIGPNLFGAICHSMIHSLPPLVSLAVAVRMIVTGYSPPKPKTDD